MSDCLRRSLIKIDFYKRSSIRNTGMRWRNKIIFFFLSLSIQYPLSHHPPHHSLFHTLSLLDPVAGQQTGGRRTGASGLRRELRRSVFTQASARAPAWAGSGGGFSCRQSPGLQLWAGSSGGSSCPWRQQGELMHGGGRWGGGESDLYQI